MSDVNESSKMPDYLCCLNCTGFNLRKANRAVSQLYDEMLRPAGIRGTQYSLLVALKISGSVLVTQLAEHAVMDRTTLTRNLEVMEKQGLVNVTPGEDRRTRMVTITEAGSAVLLEAYPLWQQAQSKIRETMSQERLQTLMTDLSALIEAAKAE
ncbi:MarR family winged helix-turn-helix transcriptional regulator [Methylosarcina fibrata]|uniref:MarR family winged helix-turn-helix transcriptional regulator n=1 Tax=Methylosarcina fibrata TaxID=105972 RepID=UPI0003699FA1|nr:MarR family winged helix-turn-helix transcriptional regulator [Methylosarcina fibrata]